MKIPVEVPRARFRRMKVTYLLVWLLCIITSASCGACGKDLSGQKGQSHLDVTEDGVRVLHSSDIEVIEADESEVPVSRVKRFIISRLIHKAAKVVDKISSPVTYDSDYELDGGSGREGRGAISAVIFLHGLGPKIQGTLCKKLAGRLIGLEKNLIRCPLAPARATAILPPSMLPFFSAVTGGQLVRSWFNFWKMPAQSLIAANGGESKEHLEESLALIEDQIDEVYSKGIPYENIVLAGMSQGGAMTLYYALHGKRKLGALLPIVAWLPLRKKEPPSQLPTPINRDTPILHLNGILDLIVPYIPAGRKSEEAMSSVFTNYDLVTTVGSHTTTFGPHTRPRIKRFLKTNMPQLQFKRSLTDLIPIIG